MESPIMRRFSSYFLHWRSYSSVGWIWIWMSSRQGPWLGHHTDELCSHGATWLVRRLLNNAKEPADTTE